MSWSDTERKVLFQEIIKQNYDSIEKADLQQLGNCVNKSEREVKSLLDNYKQEAERQLEKNIIRLCTYSLATIIQLF